MPYSSHMAIYSGIEMVPSPPVSALSNSSHRAEIRMKNSNIFSKHFSTETGIIEPGGVYLDLDVGYEWF